MMRTSLIQSLCLALIFALSAVSGMAKMQQPNFVVIFVDDMGYGDIEPYGSKLSKTPELSRMADEGMKFTSFYAAAPLCSPSRAALMTGSYPKRVGLDVGSIAPVLLAKEAHGLHPGEKTIAELLKEGGYATGCFGKWHLGDQPEFMPNNHGFDRFFGLPYSNDLWPYTKAPKGAAAYPPLPLMQNDQVIEFVENMDDQAQLCRRFTEEAVSFIKENKDQPFFVYLPHTSVHHPRTAPVEFLDRAGKQRNLDEERMRNDKKYAMDQRLRAQVEELDWSTGQVLECLRKLGLAERTMVIFTSDNGPSAGASSGPLKGNKGKTFEGGMRVPMLAWWPNTIPAGTTCDEVATVMDFLPTFVKLSGGKLPNDRLIDGKNITSLLQGDAEAKSPYKAFYYYKRSALDAVRSGKWKLTTSGALYNLDEDIGERKNIAMEYPEVVDRLKGYLAVCRADLDQPENCREVGKNYNPQYIQ